jgi:polyisoprenoid-binding protein YceI
MKTLVVALGFCLLPHAAQAAKAAKAPKAETYKVDTKASIAHWEGRKLGGAHQGELKFQGGELKVEKGELRSGTVTIDMTTLKDYDQEGAMNTKLVNHLKSDDFFSVEKHPTSSLKITKTEKQGDKTMITGELTIKGITKPIHFPAEVKIEGPQLKAKGEMTVDRTLYDIKFRSLKFFANIGDKVIRDEFTVSVDLTANK